MIIASWNRVPTDTNTRRKEAAGIIRRPPAMDRVALEKLGPSTSEEEHAGFLFLGKF